LAAQFLSPTPSIIALLITVTAIAAFLLGIGVRSGVNALRRPRTFTRNFPSSLPPDILQPIIADLFESTPNGIGLWDRDLRCLRVNKALADATGLLPEAHLGKRLREINRDLADTLEPMFREVLRSGEPVVNLDVIGRNAVGHDHRFWRASYYPVHARDQSIVGVGAVIVDVTEIKRVESALRQREERYRAFIEQTAEAVWRVELERPVPVQLSVDEQVARFMRDGYLAECNDVMARMYGFGTASEIVGARLPDLLDPADPRNIEFLAAFVRSNYRLLEAESHERARDGSDRYFVNNLIGIVEGGVVCRAWGTQRDITERTWAEEALRQSREQLRVALRAARMATWRWDLQSDTRVWDAEAAAMLAIAEVASDGRGLTFLEQIHPDDRSRVSEGLRSAIDEGGRFREEYRVISPDGTTHWLTDQGELIRDDGGRPLYMAGACVDVTHHRRIEDQLRQAQRMDAVGRLAGGMAHETNNQMAVVLGFADFILGRSDLPERVKEDVEQIRRAAERTAGITGQLLAFSRRQFARPKVLRLSEVIAAFEPVLKRAMSSGCELRLRSELGAGLVKADPGQIEQVLLNLALNACDAMPQGGTLTIETTEVTLTREYARSKPGVRVTPGLYLQVAVNDTGLGMSRDTLSRVFEPFFTTKAVGQGTGLGLATVYGLVKQADGYIWVYSEQGIGTTFKIYFPVISSEESVPIDAEPSPSPASGELVLVVEDEPDVMRMAVRALGEAGYTVVQASGGPEALEIILEAGVRLRLVLTDVIMPVMNGRELAVRIGEIRPDLPIVFMSGYTDEDVIRRGLMERGRRFIQKPFSPDALAREIRHALDSIPPALAGSSPPSSGRLPGNPARQSAS
jgi:two-component system, cell cycle sensor histidine kinase and response regulator CckA